MVCSGCCCFSKALCAACIDKGPGSVWTWGWKGALERQLAMGCLLSLVPPGTCSSKCCDWQHRGPQAGWVHLGTAYSSSKTLLETYYVSYRCWGTRRQTGQLGLGSPSLGGQDKPRATGICCGVCGDHTQALVGPPGCGCRGPLVQLEVPGKAGREQHEDRPWGPPAGPLPATHKPMSP